MIIFGVGEVAKTFYYIAGGDAFTVDKEYIPTEGSLFRLPVLPFEYEALAKWGNTHIYLPISYQKVNKVRQEKYEQIKSWGFEALRYVHPTSTLTHPYYLDEGSIVLEQCVIQPGCDIGKAVIIWSKVHCGHSCKIKDFVWLTSGAVLCGQCEIGENSFVGANAVISPGVKVGKRNIIGSGAIITKDTEDDSVYLEGRNVLYRKKSWEVQL